MSSGSTPPVLPPRFFSRSAPEVARDLLGAIVISRIGRSVTAGRIVEIEAYLGDEDPASHAYRGRRHAGNASIYLPPGTWYVYRSYGVHWCANLVCAPQSRGAAVLLRGLEPLEGLETMRRRRGGAVVARLVDGPGKLCQALGISRTLDGRPMPSSTVVVIRGDPVPDHEVKITPRIGITRAADWPLRFVGASSRRSLVLSP